MHGAHEFLKALATVMCVAAVTTVLFQRIRQPVVLGYIIAGLIVGPHLPIPLVADPEVVHTLSELGVILLMFSLGLEFSLRKLVEVAPTAGVTAVIQSSIMVWLGYMAGRAFGWTRMESVFTGAILAISSTTIIARAFDEQGIKGRLRELVVGVLIVEDLFGILLMAVVTALASGDGLTFGTVAASGGRLAAFLVLLLAVGLVVVPRAVRAVNRLERTETTLVAAMGICFACALLALEFGYSVALGAFIAGSLVAESGQARRVEHLVNPVRDVFAAVFFVSVGMQIDPSLLVEYGGAIGVLTALVVGGKVFGVTVGAFLTGSGVRTAVQSGMSLAQIGEFSFIIAGLGLSLKATGGHIYPIAVAVSALTTLSTPWLIRWSEPVALFVERKLPRPLQTFAALHASWLEGLRAGGRPGAAVGAGSVRRLAVLLALDAACLAAAVIGLTTSADAVTAFLGARVGMEAGTARIVLVVGIVLLAAPFVLGILRLSRALGLHLARAALPAAATGRSDLAGTPRWTLVVTLQLGLVLLVGIPIAAVTQPFLPGPTAGVAVGALVAFLGWTFWRSARDLDEHVQAGTEAIVEALAQHAASGAPADDGHALDVVDRTLPGLGRPVAHVLDARSPAVGRCLADLNLRGLTGATVLVIYRDGHPVTGSTATETLRTGDVLALAGATEAVDAARQSLQPPGGAEGASAR